MSAIPKVSAGYQDTLATSFSASATSFSLSSGKDLNGSYLSGLYGFTIDSEWVLATMSSGVGTVVVRGCDPANPMANVAAFQVSHRKGAPVIISDYAFLGYVWQLLTGNFTFDNLLALTAYVLPTLRTQFAPKGYVDDSITGANATASSTTAGTVKLDKAANSLPRVANVLVQQQSSPNMTLQVLPFSLAALDQNVAYVGGATSSYTAPASNPRIDLLVYSTSSSALAYRTGTENASPAVPAALQGDIVLCQIFHRVGETSLKDNDDSTNGYVQKWFPLAVYAPDSLRGATANSYVTTTGSANAYVATLSPAPAALVAGLTLRLKANFSNTAAATLAVNGLTATAITKNGNVALSGNEIISGQVFTVTYDGTQFQLGTAYSDNVLTGAAPVSLANTTALTTLATVSIPGNTLAKVNAIRGRFAVSQIQETSGSANTLTITLSYGGTVVATLVGSTPASSWAPSGGGYIDFLLVANAATNAQSGSLQISIGGGLNTGTALKGWTAGANGTAAVDSTAAQTLLVQAQWGAAHGGANLTVDHFAIDLIK